MKCRKERKKKKRMRVMSTFNCFFSHASLSNSPWLVCDSQVYSLRKLLVSDAALCICSGEDRTAAAVNYSARMPQSLLGSQPVCHQHFSPQSAFLTCIFFFFFGHQQLPKVLKSTLGRFHLHFRREPSLCFDCKDPHRNRPAF